MWRHVSDQPPNTTATCATRSRPKSTKVVFYTCSRELISLEQIGMYMKTENKHIITTQQWKTGRSSY
ncbi:hypothetical protein C1H46_045864 [Malus baccata]|uniref:Uncharacterized protein n=1 Tax=Malus baccata TaxID=106549 RepID=A0A540K2V0_MALBA|nr:hypothetical protein C1H46_045864 [Malus baccata]